MAAAGYGGSEYASANEVSNAIHQQQNGKSNGHHKPPADPKAEFERMVKELGVDDKTMSECLKYHECEDVGSVPESKRREFYKDLALTTQTDEVNA